MLISQRPTLSEEVIAENRSQFVIEPLEPGFGYTLANSLRRTLMSSIPGAAVTSIRIDGVLHPVYQMPMGVLNAMTARIKLLGRMDVVEKRRPLDGRIKTVRPMVEGQPGGEVEMRLLPGAVGKAASPHEDSFWHGLLDYPHYTRPAEWNGRLVLRGMESLPLSLG
mgnify:CR=1 FL=1